MDGLTLYFDQNGVSFDRLRTTKNGRAAPPLSEALRTLTAAAAHAVTSQHGTVSAGGPRVTRAQAPLWPVFAPHLPV